MNLDTALIQEGFIEFIKFLITKKINMFQKVKIMPQYSNLYQKLFQSNQLQKETYLKFKIGEYESTNKEYYEIVFELSEQKGKPNHLMKYIKIINDLLKVKLYHFGYQQTYHLILV